MRRVLSRVRRLFVPLTIDSARCSQRMADSIATQGSLSCQRPDPQPNSSELRFLTAGMFIASWIVGPARQAATFPLAT